MVNGALFSINLIISKSSSVEVPLAFIGIWASFDQGIKFCSIFKVLGMRRKTVPLRPSRLPDSGGIFTFANGVRMEEISRSVRQAKQAKIWDADCTCPYSPYGHVEGRTIMMTWQFDDMAHIGWLFVGEYGVDTCLVGSE
jgi:hypothetical protein